MTPVAEPASDAELFDLLYRLFGIGDHDQDDAQPWYKFRLREIAKLKAIRKKRGVSLADFTLAARYCYRRRVTVHDSWQVPQHLAQARREAKAAATSDLSQQIEAAVAAEQAGHRPDQQWVTRLLRARGRYRVEVLEAWRSARQTTTPVPNRGDAT